MASVNVLVFADGHMSADTDRCSADASVHPFKYISQTVNTSEYDPHVDLIFCFCLSFMCFMFAVIAKSVSNFNFDFL